MSYMKYKKSVFYTITILTTVFLFVVGTLFLMIVAPRFFFELRLSRIPSETCNAPMVYVNGTLHTQNKQYEIAALCREQNYSFREILCVLDEKAYVICFQSNNWVALSYDLKSGELCELFTYQNPGTYYKVNPSEQMKNRNGFYDNDHIVLTNGVTVISYCISSQSIETSAYSNYAFPENTITGRTISSESVEIRVNGEPRQFSFAQIAEDSNGIGAIYAMKAEKYWDGPSRIPYFFNECSVQIVGNCVYAIGSCLHYYGESYAIILQYDTLQGTWKYVGYYFFGDIVDEECYIVFTQ